MADILGASVPRDSGARSFTLLNSPAPSPPRKDLVQNVMKLIKGVPEKVPKRARISAE